MPLQNKLNQNGFVQLHLSELETWRSVVECKDWYQLDQMLFQMFDKNGYLFQLLSNFYQPIENIEHIIAIRQPPDEEGIWHDDGSRFLAFTISFTLDSKLIEGGHLLFRKKGQFELQEIVTPAFGTMTIFRTGYHGYEHCVTEVTSGTRIICAGWIT